MTSNCEKVVRRSKSRKPVRHEPRRSPMLEDRHVRQAQRRVPFDED